MTTNKYAWTTPRGAKIELTVTTEHITEENIYNDGWETTVSCDRWVYKIEALTVNGEKKTGTFMDYDNMPVIKYGEKIVKGKKCLLLLDLPGDVDESIYGAERKQVQSEIEEMRKQDEEFALTKNKPCPRCGTWCYGDCSIK